MNSSNLNLTATHNGFGLNHNSMNQTHSNHFNSTSSVLTYRSNRRSMDRSDNKISDTISPSSIRNTLPCNDPIQEGISQSRSYFNMCLRIIYKMLMFINNGFSKRRPNNLQNSNGRLPESLFNRILSILRYRVIGNDISTYSHNDSGTEQSSYIERIDDENMENTDLMVNANTNTNTKVTTSFAASAPVAVELPTGKWTNFFLISIQR